MSFDCLVLVGMCPKHVYTCFSQTNRNQQPEGRGIGKSTNRARRGNSGWCQSTAYKKARAERPHAFLYTDNFTTRALPSLFSKRDQGISQAHEISRVSGSDNVVSNGDGLRSGLPILWSVHTRWSRLPFSTIPKYPGVLTTKLRRPVEFYGTLGNRLPQLSHVHEPFSGWAATGSLCEPIVASRRSAPTMRRSMV